MSIYLKIRLFTGDNCACVNTHTHTSDMVSWIESAVMVSES